MNCKKHNRLIVAVLGVDTPQEKSYCIECIEELESFKSGEPINPKEVLRGDVNIVENLFKSIRFLFRCNSFEYHAGRGDIHSSEHFFIGKHGTFAIKKTPERLVISELLGLPPEFLEELKSGERVINSILGV